MAGLSDCFPFSRTQSLEVRGEAPLTLPSNRVDRVGRAEGTRTNDIEFRWQESICRNGLWALSGMGREVKKDKEVVQNTQVRDSMPSERG